MALLYYTYILEIIKDKQLIGGDMEDTRNRICILPVYVVTLSFLQKKVRNHLHAHT